MSLLAQPRIRRVALAGILVAALLGAYVYSLRGDFLWDDDLHITANPTIIGPLGLKEIWTTARANYFPLVLTNFWVQHAMWGLEPFGYRVVTLAFHVGAALLLWRVLLQLGVARAGAWLGAAFWALHPVQVESVAWICELKNTQSAVFFLAAASSYVSWIRARAAGGAHRRYYALALLFAVLAILSKPSTVMLPVALGLCAWWIRRRVDLRDVLVLVPFFTLSAIASGWTIWEQKFHSGALGPEWSQSFAERVAIAGRVVWFYLGKLLWPEPLIFIYPRWQIDPRQPFAYLPAVAAVAGLLLLVWRGQAGRLRPVLFAAAFFVALLFPVLGFFNVYFFRYSFVGDHFQYLASMGPLAFAGALIGRLGAPRSGLVGGALAAALALMSAHQSRGYINNEVLWRHTVAHNPGAVMAWLNLADTLARAERHEEAIATFQHALTLRPDDPHALNDLGCELTIVGQPAEAVPHLQRAIALQPDHAEAHNNLGNALRTLGRRDEALAHYRRALELKPDYTAAMNNLGAELAEMGRVEEAVTMFQRVLALKPADVGAHDNLGGAWRKLGRIPEAIAQHEHALRLNPTFAEAHANLGRTLVAANRAADALPHFERALQLKPALSGLRGDFANALAAAGRMDDAIAVLQRAIEQTPNAPDVHLNLGTLLAQTGRLEEAIARFETAVRLAPGFFAAHLNLGNAYAALTRWAQAAEHFQSAVTLQPQSAIAHGQRAVALVNSDRLEVAVPHFEAALRLGATAELHEQFAQVLRALGRTREAFEHFERGADLRRQRSR